MGSHSAMHSGSHSASCSPSVARARRCARARARTRRCARVGTGVAAGKQALELYGELGVEAVAVGDEQQLLRRKDDLLRRRRQRRAGLPVVLQELELRCHRARTPADDNCEGVALKVRCAAVGIRGFSVAGRIKDHRVAIVHEVETCRHAKFYLQVSRGNARASAARTAVRRYLPPT